MKFISVRLITDDITRLVQFYEDTLGIKATWATPDFAEIGTSVGTLAIGSTKTLAFFGAGVAAPKANKSVILEFRAADVDKDYARAKEFISDIVQEPTTMPWGNRSLLFRDPDGNLVNLFTPVSPEAIKKFGG
jgi:predicted enzyme related to lactoylglutathione lyase